MVTEETKTMLRFAAVGVINTLVGTAIMFGLYNLAGASYWASSAANYILTSILSFVLNRNFTFKHDGGIAGSGFRFAVNIAACYLIAYGIAKPCALMLLAETSKAIQENIAMFIGMCLFVILNYIGQKKFVFKKNKTM